MEKIQLNREFYERDPKKVAIDLLGKLLVVQIDGKYRVGRIVETEAYLGFGDKASHSHRGMTNRNKVMFGPAGYSYVYFTYGMHWLLNFITGEEGQPSGVLIRAAEPLLDPELDLSELSKAELKRLGAGPARLTKWFNINGNHNGIDITKSGSIFATDSFQAGGEALRSEKILDKQIKKAPRIGVGFAGRDAERLLRFYIKDNYFISKGG